MKKIYTILLCAIAFFSSLYSMEDLSQSIIGIPREASQKSENPISKRKICSTLQANVKKLESEKYKKPFINNLESLKNSKNIFNNPNVSTNIFRDKQINNLIHFIEENPFNKNLIPAIETQLQEICQKTATSFNNITIKTSSAVDSLLKARNDVDRNKLIDDIDQNIHLMMDFMEMQGSRARIDSLTRVLAEIKLIPEDNAMLTRENIKKWKTKLLAASVVSLEKKPMDTSEIVLPQKEKEIAEDIEKLIEKQTPKTLKPRSYSSTSLKLPKISMAQRSKKLRAKEYESLPSSEIKYAQQSLELPEQSEQLNITNEFTATVQKLNTMAVFEMLNEKKNEFIQGIISLADGLKYANDDDKEQLKTLAQHPFFKRQMLLEKRYEILTQGMNKEEQQQFEIAWNTIINYVTPEKETFIKTVTTPINWKDEEGNPIDPNVMRAAYTREPIELNKLPKETIDQLKRKQEELEESRRQHGRQIDQETREQEERYIQQRETQQLFEKNRKENAEKLKEERDRTYQADLDEVARRLNEEYEQENAKRWMPRIINTLYQARQSVTNFVSNITSTVASWWSWLMGR